MSGSSEVRKQGVLHVMTKPPGETLTERYYVLLGPSEKNQARLDWYDNEEIYKNAKRNDQKKRKTIYIEEMAKVSYNIYKGIKFTFQIECRDKNTPHIFQAPNEQEKRLWITLLEDLIENCGHRMSGEHSLSSANSLDDQIQDYTFTAEPRNFRISMQTTAASERHNFQGEYDLIIGPTTIQLKNIKSGDISCTWPIKCIRRYGKSKSNFTFESGRRCDTGDGMWKLNTTQGEDIFTLIQQNTNEMRKHESKTTTSRQNSTDDPPNLPTRNYDQNTYVAVTSDKAKEKSKPGKAQKKEDKKKSKKPDKKIKHNNVPAKGAPDNSQYANYEEAQYENNAKSGAALPPPTAGGYSEPLAANRDHIEPDPTYSEPVIPGQMKMSDVVAQLKQNKDHGPPRLGDMAGGAEYDHIVFNPQHSSALPPGATGNTYDRLDGMGPAHTEDGTYSEIGNMR